MRIDNILDSIVSKLDSIEKKLDKLVPCHVCNGTGVIYIIGGDDINCSNCSASDSRVQWRPANS